MLVIFLPRILFLASCYRGVGDEIPDRGINLSDASRTSLQPRLYYHIFNIDNFCYYIAYKSLSTYMKEKPIKHSFRTDEYTAEILENLMAISGKNKTNILIELIENNADRLMKKEQVIRRFHDDFNELKTLISSLQKNNSTLNQIIRFLNSAEQNATAEQYQKLFKLMCENQQELIRKHRKTIEFLKKILNLCE